METEKPEWQRILEGTLIPPPPTAEEKRKMDKFWEEVERHRPLTAEERRGMAELGWGGRQVVKFNKTSFRGPYLGQAW